MKRTANPCARCHAKPRMKHGSYCSRCRQAFARAARLGKPDDSRYRWRPNTHPIPPTPVS